MGDVCPECNTDYTWSDIEEEEEEEEEEDKKKTK